MSGSNADSGLAVVGCREKQGGPTAEVLKFGVSGGHTRVDDLNPACITQIKEYTRIPIPIV